MILETLGIGLLSSGTHCAGMCGPIHLLLRQGKTNPIWYHFGRILGYSFQGLIFASFGATLGNTSPIKIIFPSYHWLIPIVLGVIYLILSLEFLGLPLRLEQRLSRVFPHKKLQSFLKSQTTPGVFLAGAIASFLPCPSTLAALSLALMVEEVWMGPTIMILFGLGTTPAFALLSWKAIQIKLNHTKVLRYALGLYFVFISGRQWVRLYSILQGSDDSMSCH